MISIVSPVFNSESCLEELVTRIYNSTKKFNKKIEIVLVDDGSEDSSWSKIVKLKKKFNLIKGIKLKKNYGQHVAIYCGIKNTTQDIIIVMDCDLQDDPRHIPEMVQKYLKEKKPVIIHHDYDNFKLKDRITSNIFWYILILVSFMKFSPYLGNYLLINKDIKKKYLKFSETTYLYGDLIFQKNKFIYIKKKRLLGIRNYTTYNLLKLLKFAMNLIIRFNIFRKIFRQNKVKKLRIEIEKKI